MVRVWMVSHTPTGARFGKSSESGHGFAALKPHTLHIERLDVLPIAPRIALKDINLLLITVLLLAWKPRQTLRLSKPTFQSRLPDRADLKNLWTHTPVVGVREGTRIRAFRAVPTNSPQMSARTSSHAPPPARSSAPSLASTIHAALNLDTCSGKNASR